MKLVFIHGAPGAGKLTTGRALLSRVHGRLHDNLAAIDAARSVFDFGASEFWDLVQTVRISVIDAAARRHVPIMVLTFVYVEPDDIVTFEQFEAVVEQHGGQLLPVFLQCTTNEIVRRIRGFIEPARPVIYSLSRGGRRPNGTAAIVYGEFHPTHAVRHGYALSPASGRPRRDHGSGLGENAALGPL